MSRRAHGRVEIYELLNGRLLNNRLMKTLMEVSPPAFIVVNDTPDAGKAGTSDWVGGP